MEQFNRREHSGQSSNEAGRTDRKTGGQKNGIPVYFSVPHFSVSRSSVGVPRSLRSITTVAVQYKEHTEEQAAGQLVVLTWRAKTITFPSSPL
jgi:hypothetical protein